MWSREHAVFPGLRPRGVTLILSARESIGFNMAPVLLSDKHLRPPQGGEKWQ